MPRTQVPELHPSPQCETLDQELAAPTDPNAGLIWINPERVGGAPCFDGTRVPVKHLWDYLEGGETLAEFLEGFPGVTRDQAIGVLEMAFQRLMDSFPRL